MSNVTSIGARLKTPAQHDAAITIRDYTGYVGLIYTLIWGIGERLSKAREDDLPWERVRALVQTCHGELSDRLRAVRDGMTRLADEAAKRPGVSDPRSVSFAVAVEVACRLIGTLQEFVDENDADPKDFDYALGEMAFEFHGADPAWPVVLKIQELAERA